MSFSLIKQAKSYKMPKVDGVAQSTMHHVFMWLCFFANDEGEAFPTTETLMNNLYLTKRSVKTALKALLDCDLIQDTGKKTGRTKQVTIYKINQNWIERDANQHPLKECQSAPLNNERGINQHPLKVGQLAPLGDERGVNCSEKGGQLAPHTPSYPNTPPLPPQGEDGRIKMEINPNNYPTLEVFLNYCDVRAHHYRLTRDEWVEVWGSFQISDWTMPNGSPIRDWKRAIDWKVKNFREKKSLAINNPTTTQYVEKAKRYVVK